MRAFIDCVETKEIALKRAAEHRAADNFIQGTYDDKNGKGCSVGCMMKPFKGEDESWHEAAERVHGIPQALAFLQDRMFEGLEVGKAKAWTERFYNAIPVGADLDLVVPRFMHWMMTDPEGIRKHADHQGLKAIDTVADLYERRLKGDTISIEEWEAAAWAAEAAARAAAYERMADKLIELIETAPVPEIKEAA